MQHQCFALQWPKQRKNISIFQLETKMLRVDVARWGSHPQSKQNILFPNHEQRLRDLHETDPASPYETLRPCLLPSVLPQMVKNK